MERRRGTYAAVLEALAVEDAVLDAAGDVAVAEAEPEAADSVAVALEVSTEDNVTPCTNEHRLIKVSKRRERDTHDGGTQGLTSGESRLQVISRAGTADARRRRLNERAVVAQAGVVGRLARGGSCAGDETRLRAIYTTKHKHKG